MVFPVPLPQLTRQWIILQELAASRMGRTLISLGRAGEVHERTARRDVYALMEAGFPIEKVEGSEPVRFRFVPGRSLPRVPLDFAEAMVLYQAALTSPVSGNARCSRLVEAGLNKIQQALPGEIREYLGRFRAAYFHRPTGTTETDLTGILKVLQKQITYRNRIRFAYRNLRGKDSERTVDPYLIHPHEGRFYLLGFCHLRQEPRLFRVDCLENLQALDEEYSLPPGFDPAGLLRTSLGIHLGNADRAVLLFEGTAARFVSRTPLHPDQQILQSEDGHLLLEVPIRGFKEVTELVMRFGAEAEVVAPPALRDHVRSTLQAALARYPAD
jgi:predicted DNA-binding transcriptional regulator YafY